MKLPTIFEIRDAAHNVIAGLIPHDTREIVIKTKAAPGMQVAVVYYIVNGDEKYLETNGKQYDLTGTEELMAWLSESSVLSSGKEGDKAPSKGEPVQ